MVTKNISKAVSNLSDIWQERRTTIQIKEIYEHKYYQSKSCSYDIGIDSALNDWVESEQALRFSQVFNKNKKRIEKICNTYCGCDCQVKGILDSEKRIIRCPLKIEYIHHVLDD